MALNVNTNIASLNAQRNLTKSGSELGVSLQRLSTGLRINSAKDDAAGLAISERFTTQIRGLNQAARNANDAISLSQTAEGSLQEVGNNLQRIRELAVQSANATNSTSDRAALDAEVQQLLAEIDRVGTSTSFNGVKLLDGSFTAQAFQVGANSGETVSVSLGNFTALQLGKIAESAGTGATAGALTGANLAISIGNAAGKSISASSDYVDASNGGDNGGGEDSAYAKVRAINASGVAGLTATTSDATSSAGAATTGFTGAAGDTYSLVINGTTIVDEAANATNKTADELADLINAQQGNTNVVATSDGTNFTLTSSEGRSIELVQTIGGGAGAGGLATETAYGGVTLSAAENISFTGGGEGLIGHAGVITLGANGLSSRDVTTVDNASSMINAIDAALSTINSARADFGAIQNRFESVIANIQTTSENLTASRSRIQDADFAAETAALTRNQILQQAGVSILAQANALPQLALSLLQ